MMLEKTSRRCQICETETIIIGSKPGKFKQKLFHLRHCPTCHFSFISNHWTDYEQIYSADYYIGQGADPLVDYLFELEHPRQTIRQYEWRGVLKVIKSLINLTPATNWLDFGCGNGGLVRYCLTHEACHIIGFDRGWIAKKATGYGIPFLEPGDLNTLTGTFDIVTAIEVLEHIAHPLSTLKQIRALLKRGGLFFYTTANAKPFQNRLLSWPYIAPEIHISFFQPDTLTRALTLAGFRPEFKGFLPGFNDIIRFKVLKNLKMRRSSIFEKAFPWTLLARIIDFRLKTTAHPIGWATNS